MYRDVDGWRSVGLPLTTTSNEAAKAYDSCLTQLTSWREDSDGLEATMGKLISVDGEFVMGKVLYHALNLIGTGDSGRKNPQILEELIAQRSIAKCQNCTDREIRHVEAAIHLAAGRMSTACQVWEDILKDYPTDMLALKLSHDSYFYLGNQKEMRSSIERVFPKWNQNLPLYSYLYGMHAFSLCETDALDSAEEAAVKGLNLNRHDAWSTHALAHVHEMRSDPQKGIAFLSRTLSDWQPCGLLACHNFWHWAVYHIEEGEFEAALDLFDSEVGERSSSGAMLDYVDAASLLYRLELEGVNVGDRWKPLYSVTEDHLHDHILLFNDAHFAMTLLGLREDDTMTKFMTSIQSVQDIAEIDNYRITNDFGKKLILSMTEYADGNFDIATECLLSIKDRWCNMGGSNAQRDVFDLLLINSAIKSNTFKNEAKVLLDCRAAKRRSSPMVQRMRTTLMSS